MAFSFIPREDEYFDLFLQISGKIQAAADKLVEMFEGPASGYDSSSKNIKSLEHECDELTHTITRKLNKSFITPFDREDIYSLSVRLDDVCDYIDAAARAVVMYDIKAVDVHAQHLTVVIQKLAREINSAVSLLKKSDGMKPHLLEIQRLENDADEIYFRGIADLFKNGTDPVTIIKLKELYEILENATDICESVGNIMESIVLKHN